MIRHAACVATLTLGLTGISLAQDLPSSVEAKDIPFTMSVLTTGLDAPWELTYGPDDMLWVTERVGGRILRINPADASQQVAVEIDEAIAPGGQDGLLGLALHPELLEGTGNDYVYTAYTYKDEWRGPDHTVGDAFSPYRFLYTKIVRFTFDPDSGTLGDPVDVIRGLPAHNDHNSGRLKIGPDMKLYYTIGDGGKNQLGNWCLPIEAQRLPTEGEVSSENFIAYQGKSLRLELDGSIPSDNPEIDGLRSHVFTYGHRNMQGIDFAADGTLYGAEHGPKADDEVNILVGGGNYGWPQISGFRDDMAYQYARWADASVPCQELKFSDLEIDPSVPVENETDWPGTMIDPIATMFTVPSDWDFSDPTCQGIDFICWPTVAPSSIEVFEPNAGDNLDWGKSLLVTTLKRGSLYRIPLAEDGQTVAGPIERYFQSENRFRDLALSPDNSTIYVATDVSGVADKTGGGVTTTMANPGAILVFTYAPGSTESAAAGADSEMDSDSAGDAAMAATGKPPTFTATQAARGKVAYDAYCVACHGPDLKAANYGPPLAGDYFDGKWVGQTVGSLYTHTFSRMPPSRPGTLPEQTYADLVAYILQVNGGTSGGAELPASIDVMDGMIIGQSQ